MNTNHVSLRPASNQDLDFLLKLRLDCMHEHFARVGIVYSKEQHLERINYRFDTAKIIVKDQQRVGMVKYFRDQDQWIIIQLQIAPECQCQGIGSYLVNGIIEKAEQEGIPVSLSVLKKNPAQHLYKRLGFKVTDEFEHELSMTWRNNPVMNSL